MAIDFPLQRYPQPPPFPKGRVIKEGKQPDSSHLDRPKVTPAPQSFKSLLNKEEIYEKLYDLKMLDSVLLNGSSFLRVPGGWVYNQTVFIPYLEKENNYLKKHNAL